MRTNATTPILLAGFMLLAAPGVCRAQGQSASSLPQALEGVRFDQHLGESIPLDTVFRDQDDREIKLGDLVGDRPILLDLVYYECPMLCQLSLNGLASSLKPVNFDVGEEFDVVVVSIDPGETAEMAAAAKERTLHRYGRDGTAAGWHFLTGDEAEIARLADSVGFGFRYDPETDEYSHAAGVVLLTPRGRIARYFFGVEYAPKDIRLGLVEASEEKIGNVVDQLLLFCFHYDPSLGKYTTTVLNVIRLGGLLTVLTMAAFIGIMLMRDRNRNARKKLGTA